MKMKLTLLLGLASVMSAYAFDIKLDGKLDEPQWKTAQEHADFRPYQGGDTHKVMPKTSFKIINDGTNLYLGVYCKEPEMKKLVAPVQKFPWKSDLVEFFMSPSCRQDEFYQFVVSAGNVRWCEYYGESGNIRPDPGYAPLWDSAVFKGKDFWSIEIRIPLAGFYNTRNSQWQTTWLFNMTRDRKPGGANGTTWSPLVNRNQDSFLFRKLGGFPKRQPKDDFFIQNVIFNAATKDANGYAGKMKLDIFSAAEGTQSLYCGKEKIQISLRKDKKNIVCFPYRFSGSGRQYVTFRLNNGNTAGRTYPVIVKYEPISIFLKTPEYANTFYPGQNKDKVAGTVHCESSNTVTLIFEGEGITPQKLVLKNNGSFSFDSSKIGVKGATLTASANAESVQVKINAPAPSVKRMAWIEGGKVIINGKRVFVREIEGIGNYTGRKFNAIFSKDQGSFHINNDLVRHVTVEPRLMVKGIESEAVFDKVPSKILFDAITKRIQQYKNTDFTFYMLVDEPECRNISPVYLEHLYKYIKSLDPYHPVKLCTREPARFVNCADYFTMHPYWGPYFDANGKRTHSTPMAEIPFMFKGWTTPGKASSLTPQVFSYRNFWNRVADFPTVDEIESSIWASIICGSAGVHAYHYHDLGDRAVLYEGMRFIMTELERLNPFILSDDRKELPSPKNTLTAVFTANGNKLLVLVNLSEVPVQMGAPLKGLKEFCGKGFFNGQVTLKPFQTALFTSVKLDQGLKGKAEVLAEIRRQEHLRLGTKNILLEKGFDINVTFSGCNHFNTRDWTQSKLFDGNFNVMAWGNTQFRDSWMELGFARFTPEFTRLILHGFNLEKATVKYWKDGKWNNLKTIASVKNSQYKTEFICKSPVRTVKLRLEFPKNNLPYELYEVEAYNDENTSASNAVPQKTTGPDPLKAKENILWRQDGKNIVVGKNGWKSKYLKIYANKDGDFTISGSTQGKGISPSADTYVPVSKDYPWIVFRLKNIKDVPGNKYHAWCIQGPKMGVFFQDSPIPGIYAVNMNEKQYLGKDKMSYIAVYSYHQELTFEEISIVKKMECMVSAKFEKNGISVTAQLQKPAESVSVRVCDCFKPLTDELTLKPVNKDRLLWKGNFTFSKPLQNKKKTVFPAGQLNLRTDVLGGSVPVPVFTKIFQAYPIK